MPSTPASAARDYSHQIDWLANLQIQTLKTVSQCCYYGLNATSEKLMHEYCVDLYPDVMEQLTGSRLSVPQLFNQLKKQYNWLTWELLHYRIFHRRTQLERNHERTPVHGAVVPIFNKLGNCDVESNVDWTRYTPRVKTAHLLIPEDAIAEWKRKGNKWISEGPDTLLPPGSLDPTRNFPHTLEFERKLLSRYGKICYWCRRPLDGWVADHFYPHSKGGRTVIENCVPTCHYCNQHKKDNWPSTYLLTRMCLEITLQRQFNH